MSTTRPEADIEYSRGQQGSEPDFEPLSEAWSGRPKRRPNMISWGLLAGGLGGAALLAVAEFTTLFTIHTSTGQMPSNAIQTGAHDSYALLPVAVLAALLSLEVWRHRGRLALVATGVLGLVALLIALLGDLPDAHASGLAGSAATGLRIARSSPSTGLYLETLGAVVLLITAVSGLLLLAPPDGGRGPHRPRRGRPRAAPNSPRSQRRKA